MLPIDSFIEGIRMSRKFKGIAGGVLAVIIIASLIIISNSLVITQENNGKLIKRFGKVDSVITDAGISLKTPLFKLLKLCLKTYSFTT